MKVRSPVVVALGWGALALALGASLATSCKRPTGASDGGVAAPTGTTPTGTTPTGTTTVGTGPAGHGAGDADDADPADSFIKDLEQQETALRASTNWATLPSSDKTLGPDPIDVVALPSSTSFAGVLRGADALVRLDSKGRELQRVPGPRAARAVAVRGDVVAVVGELDPRVMIVRVSGGAFGAGSFVRVEGAKGFRGIALGEKGRIFVTDLDGNLVTLDERGTKIGSRVVGPGASHVELAGAFVVTMSVLGHTIAVDIEGEKRLTELKNDGPFWGFTTRVVPRGVLVAAGHVEDHPLDRHGGSFGYIDSFVTVWRINDDATVEKLASLNTSALGVVTPKALAFLDDKTLLAVGAGSGAGVQIDIDTSATEEVKGLPGIVAVAIAGNAVLGADPLLDAWISLASPPVAVPVPVSSSSKGAVKRSVESKLGEALVFTTIMAPRQKSDGPLSRFTCEACHFEGGGDGRVHDTARVDASNLPITATAKPLMGLFNNKPLFTRAMDEDLAVMAHAEFRVANANSTLDPWFALTPADAPFLALLGVSGTQAPIDLRRAMLAFLHDFTPRTNAAVVGHSKGFTELEAHGADIFRARCASCHMARLIGDDAKTEQPFDKWASFLLSDNAPLVWSGDGRKKTGVEPYVHEEGARPSSLRRIGRKVPYFTNGRAHSLAEVIELARFDDSTFLHMSTAPSSTPDAGPAPATTSATAPEGRFSLGDENALLAFLELL